MPGYPQDNEDIVCLSLTLCLLQRYDEAAQAFKEVLQLDSSCVDAAQELMRVQIIQLMVRSSTYSHGSPVC